MTGQRKPNGSALCRRAHLVQMVCEAVMDRRARSSARTTVERRCDNEAQLPASFSLTMHPAQHFLLRVRRRLGWPELNTPFLRLRLRNPCINAPCPIVENRVVASACDDYRASTPGLCLRMRRRRRLRRLTVMRWLTCRTTVRPWRQHNDPLATTNLEPMLFLQGLEETG